MIKIIAKNNLIGKFKLRINVLLKNTESSGYGFCDMKPVIYYSYVDDEE